MATKRIKDLTNTATSVASDSYLAIDGTSNGTEKITRDNFRQDTADAFVAAPGTYNLAPLSGGAVEVAKGGTGSTTAAGARTNLSVNSIDEDAQANALKTTAPSMYFNGSSSVVTVADDDKFSFTDGTDDLPFSISAWVKAIDATSFSIVSKYSSSAATQEWRFQFAGDDKLNLTLQNGSGSNAQANSDTAMTAYEGKWVHVAAAYAGAGPNSGNAFTSAGDGITLYVNGEAVASTPSTEGSYSGMLNTAQPVYIGRQGGQYAEGHIKEIKIFNRTLTSNEIAELARGNDLGFSEEWGGAHGAVYTSDFSTNTDGNTGIGGTTAGNIDTIGGQDDNLRLTINSSTSDHYFTKGAVFTTGRRHRMEFDYYIPSTNSVLDGISASIGESAEKIVSAPTQNQWNHFSMDAVAIGGTNTSKSIYIFSRDGGVRSYAGNGTDVMYVRNIQVTEIGTLADFRAERYDTSTNKLYDLSDNAFVGTGTSVSLTGREQPVYETGTWTPSITFGGGSTGIAYTEQGGYYTRVGDICFVRGIVFLSNKGTDTGALKIVGLPFTSSSAGSNTSLISTYMTAAAGLTSNVVGLIDDGGTGITISDFGASGATTLDDTNVSNTTIIRFSGTYQIQ